MFETIWAIDPVWGQHFIRQMAAPTPANYGGRGAPVVMEQRPTRNNKSVAIIRANGVLTKGSDWYGSTSSRTLSEAVRNAAGDNSVTGIVLSVYSPGGMIAGLDELLSSVRAASKMKPVVGYAEDMALSAGYEIMTPADAIYANNTRAFVGSIGTLLPIADTSGAAEKSGAKMVNFASGALKSIGGDGGISPEQAAHIQSIVDKLGAAFVDTVRKARSLSPTQVDRVKTGAAFVADEAKELKLIDGFKSLDKIISELA